MTTPRARLQQRDYVSAAFDIAGEDGLDALTLKALGQRLGVDSTAVYRHFKSKDVLLIAMLDQLLSDRLQPSEAFESGRDEMEHIVTVLHSVLVAHPPLAVAMIINNDLPDPGIRLIERAVDTLARMGLDGEVLVQRYQMLEHFVLGACILDSDGAPDGWSVRQRRYEKVGAREFRSVARSADDVARVSHAAFRDGLRVMLDACAASAV